MKHSVAGTYADDTQSSVAGKDVSNVKKELEEDAAQVLRFIASNQLIANPKKTVFVMINLFFVIAFRWALFVFNAYVTISITITCFIFFSPHSSLDGV